MKNYVKPEINVVELSVKETMAALPAGIQTTVQGTDGGYVGEKQDIPLTVYNLTSLNTSQVNG